MSTHNHTAISTGAAANASTINTPLGALDAAIGDLTTLTTTAKTSAVAALNEVDANADAANAAVGTLASLTTTAKTSAVAAINEVDANADAAAALVGTLASLTTTDKTSAVAAINEVDASAASALARPTTNVVWDGLNNNLYPGDEWNPSKPHWYQVNNMTIVKNDASNPFGANTLRMGTAAALAGKRIYFIESGLRLNDTVTFKCLAMAAAGDFYLAARPINSAGTLIGGQVVGSTVTMSGAAQTMSVTITLDTALTAGVMVYPVRDSGSDVLNIYALWGSTGDAGGQPSLLADPESVRAMNDQFVFDPLNVAMPPGYEWQAHRSHWQTKTNLSILDPDAANPFGGRTLRVGTVGTIGGKKIYFDETGLRAADVIQAKALVNAAGGTFYLAIRPIDAAGTLIGSQVAGTTTTFSGTAQLLSVEAKLDTAATAGVAIYLVRASGSSNGDIYALWCGRYPTTHYPPPQLRSYDNNIFPHMLDTYGRQHLKNWRLAKAKVENAVSGAQAVIAIIGDSWVQNDRIGNPLRTALQTAYGDAGPGYVGIGNDHGAPTDQDVTYSRAGTWVDLDAETSGRGPDLADATSTDTATPAKVSITATFTDAVIHYLKQANGGSFRWRVDAGGWTTVDTSAAAAAHATEAIDGLSAASHTLEIEISVAGVAGVTLLGVDLQEADNGVRVHRIGNGGATATQYIAPDATIWKAAITALAPDLAIILLGTNDHNSNHVPSTFRDEMRTLIDRIQAAKATCDILLLSPAANGLAGKTYLVSDYVRQLRDLAPLEACAMLDAYMHIAAYSADDVGGWENSSHLDSDGGRVVADLLLDLLA